MLVQTHFRHKWQAQWEKYQRSYYNLTTAQVISLKRKEKLDLHINLAKIESALVVQIHTKEISFAEFLYKLHISITTFLACDCDWHTQTAKHIIYHCTL